MSDIANTPKHTILETLNCAPEFETATTFEHWLLLLRNVLGITTALNSCEAYLNFSNVRWEKGQIFQEVTLKLRSALLDYRNQARLELGHDLSDLWYAKMLTDKLYSLVPYNLRHIIYDNFAPQYDFSSQCKIWLEKSQNRLHNPFEKPSRPTVVQMVKEE